MIRRAGAANPSWPGVDHAQPGRAQRPVTHGRFRLTLSDDGPGIASEDLPHIFERFYRAAAVRSSSGSGLGLAIVQEIVHRHGGEVRAERREPRGTTFVVELPPLSV